MPDDHTALLLERLRLAAALVHAVPQLALDLGADHGPHVLVSHLTDLQPDVTPCEFRRTVAHLLDSNPRLVGFGWLREIRTIEVGGVGTEVADGVVALPATGDAARLTAFATDLEPAEVMAAAREVADEFIQRDPCAIVALRQVQLRVERDDVLAVSVVTLPWSDADDAEATFITAAIAERCVVESLLTSVTSRRV